MIRNAALCLGLLGALSLPGAGQASDPCFTLDDHTQFCGKPAGWSFAPQASGPSVTTFLNQEYALTLTHQMAHGRTLDSGLYSAVLDALLLDIDARMGAPEGTHEALFVDIVRFDGIEGRRFGVQTDRTDPPTAMMIDFYISPAHLWVVQTGHVGPIPFDRLVRTHGYAMEEMRFVR